MQSNTYYLVGHGCACCEPQKVCNASQPELTPPLLFQITLVLAEEN